MIFLYDPITNILTETSYNELINMTGKSKENLMSHRSKKLKVGCINSYIADEKTTVQQRKIWYEKEKYHNEIWKTIEGSDGKFLISNYGRFQRIYKRSTAFLLPYLKKRCGNLEIKVKFQGERKKFKVSHLVAYHFVGRPKQNEVLHHKNLIKTDNYFANLEYIAREKLGKKTGHKSKSKPVVQLDRESLEVLEEFRSAREAGRQCYLSYQAVLDNCNHKSKSSGGYVFMFTEEYESLDYSQLKQQRTLTNYRTIEITNDENKWF